MTKKNWLFTVYRGGFFSWLTCQWVFCSILEAFGVYRRSWRRRLRPLNFVVINDWAVFEVSYALGCIIGSRWLFGIFSINSILMIANWWIKQKSVCKFVLIMIPRMKPGSLGCFVFAHIWDVYHISTRYGLLTVDWWFFYFVVSWILIFTHFDSYCWNEWLNYHLVVTPSSNPSNSPEHTAIPGLVVTSVLQCLTVAVCSSQIELYLLPWVH